MAVSRYQIIGSLGMCGLLLIAVWFMTKQSSTPLTIAPIIEAAPTVATKAQAAAQAVAAPARAAQDFFDMPTTTDAPELSIKEFAFEPFLKPGVVPNQAAKLSKKPAGIAPFKFVSCADNTYAIRWSGMYLTVVDPTRVEWTETKQEPNGCWLIIPGRCNSENFIMLRNIGNKHFLKPEANGDLVCKDTPTGRTATQYCWKLAPTDLAATKQPCGCIYSADLGRVVCTPCNLKEMPDTAQGSCSTVTAGYQAKCCLRKTAAQRVTDPFCGSAVWPETVGRTLQEAMLYIRTRRPDLLLRPCPTPCTVEAYPEPSPTTVIIPYDARSGLVVSSPLRLT